MTNATRFIHLLVAVLAGAPVAIAADPPRDPEAVVQVQLDAYNAHDIDAFMATYTNDAELFEHPAKLLAAGSAQLRERYGARFKDPKLHATIVKRIVMGNVVIDHEKVARTFPEGTGVADAIAIYQVENGKIAKTWLILGPRTLDAKQ